MANFKNEFSWSKSRDAVFKSCPREYWFAYYGFWNGWLQDAPERTRKIYVLKNLKTRQIWSGEKIHACIQRSISNLRRGIKVLPVDEIISITLNQLRPDWSWEYISSFIIGRGRIRALTIGRRMRFTGLPAIATR